MAIQHLIVKADGVSGGDLLCNKHQKQPGGRHRAALFAKTALRHIYADVLVVACIAAAVWRKIISMISRARELN